MLPPVAPRTTMLNECFTKARDRAVVLFSSFLRTYDGNRSRRRTHCSHRLPCWELNVRPRCIPIPVHHVRFRSTIWHDERLHPALIVLNVQGNQPLIAPTVVVLHARQFSAVRSTVAASASECFCCAQKKRLVAATRRQNNNDGQQQYVRGSPLIPLLARMPSKDKLIDGDHIIVIYGGIFFCFWRQQHALLYRI